jgi:thiol-disulfide isomerase/thioredoxin
MIRHIGVWCFIALLASACGPTAVEPAGDDASTENIDAVDTPTPPAHANPAAPTQVERFDALLLEATPIVALFESPWSPTRRQSELLLAELAATFPEQIVFILIDTDESPQLVETYAVTEYPTTLLFDAGQECARWEGPTTRAALASDLEQFLQSHLAETELTEAPQMEIQP